MINAKISEANCMKFLLGASENSPSISVYRSSRVSEITSLPAAKSTFLSLLGRGLSRGVMSSSVDSDSGILYVSIGESLPASIGGSAGKDYN